MKIKQLTLGLYATNCYIVYDEATRDSVVIDPGYTPEVISQELEQLQLQPQAILLTHGHFDHTSAVRPLLEKYPDVPVYIHEKDAADTEHGELLFRKVGPENQRFYKEGDTLPLGSLTIRVLETPGHSEGSVCLLVEGQNVLFAGDTLFRCSCGRCDFPGGDYRKMLTSLGRLASLEGNLRVLPGHDRETTLDYERRVNPYMRKGAKQ